MLITRPEPEQPTPLQQQDESKAEDGRILPLFHAFALPARLGSFAHSYILIPSLPFGSWLVGEQDDTKSSVVRSSSV